MEFPFERDARAGKPPSKYFDIADLCAYIAMQHLYALYDDGRIDINTARDEKKTVYDSWVFHKSAVDFVNREGHLGSIKIKSAFAAYKEKPTRENADKMYAAFYNLSDDWREQECKRS